MSIHPVAAELEISALAQEHDRQLIHSQQRSEARLATPQTHILVALVDRVWDLIRSFVAGPEPASRSRSLAAEHFARRQSSSATVGD